MSILLQVRPHLPQGGELHDDPDGRRAAHAHQPDDVRVRELLHYICGGYGALDTVTVCRTFIGIGNSYQ